MCDLRRVGDQLDSDRSFLTVFRWERMCLEDESQAQQQVKTM